MVSYVPTDQLTCSMRESTYESNLAASIHCEAIWAVLPKAKYSRVEPYTQKSDKGD